MICPDWRLLARDRDEDEDAWEAALDHFDECTLCREPAIEVEPTLLFRGMSSPAGEGFGADDLAAIKSAVSTMRRAQSYQRPMRSIAWDSSTFRAAALGALLVSAGLLQGTGALKPEAATLRSGGPRGQILAWSPVPGDSALAEPATVHFSDTRSLDQIPLIEDLDPAYGSIIQVIDQEISLLVVVPASLDV